MVIKEIIKKILYKDGNFLCRLAKGFFVLSSNYDEALKFGIKKIPLDLKDDGWELKKVKFIILTAPRDNELIEIVLGADIID